MSRLEQMTLAAYLFKVQWEYEFDYAGKPKLLAIQRSTLRTRASLYGGPTEALHVHYKARENETIKYVDVINLYPYIFK